LKIYYLSLLRTLSARKSIEFKIEIKKYRQQKRQGKVLNEGNKRLA